MATLFKNSTLIGKFSHQELSGGEGGSLGRSAPTGGQIQESFAFSDKGK